MQKIKSCQYSFQNIFKKSLINCQTLHTLILLFCQKTFLSTSEWLCFIFPKLFSLYTQEAFIESYRPSSLFKWKLDCSSTLGKLPRFSYSRYILVTELFQCFFLIFFNGGVISFFFLRIIYNSKSHVFVFNINMSF